MIGHREATELGISMALCELDSDESLCKEDKTSLVRVHLESVSGYEDFAEYDLVVDRATAQEVMGDQWESFVSRNNIKEDWDPLYLEKLKKEKDEEKLRPHARRYYTGWIELDTLPADVKSKLLGGGEYGDVVTEWDMLSFDEMNERCQACDLSWDKGRGCIGTFGPTKSRLPGIAEKYDCSIVASVFDLAESREKLSPEDAEQLIEEARLLREKLPEEGGRMVQWYSGVVDRLEAMSEAAAEYGTRFYFI